jgi:hypothetical protein
LTLHLERDTPNYPRLQILAHSKLLLQRVQFILVQKHENWT